MNGSQDPRTRVKISEQKKSGSQNNRIQGLSATEVISHNKKSQGLKQQDSGFIISDRPKTLYELVILKQFK